MENKDEALNALNKIEKIIKEVSDIFPNIKTDNIKISDKKLFTPVDTLKRVGGIIMNYNESNAENKLENLIKYLGGISSNEK